MCVPQVYWDDVNNSAINGSASLSAINGKLLTLASVKVGLKLMLGDYNSLHVWWQMRRQQALQFRLK